MARYHHSSYYDYLQYFSFSIHFGFFLAIVFIFLIFNWYINYESTFEDFMDNFKICLMVFPVVLLLFVHWLSRDDREPFDLSFPEKDSFHRVGASPVGVAILLVFLIFMIPHHSSLEEGLKNGAFIEFDSLDFFITEPSMPNESSV